MKKKREPLPLLREKLPSDEVIAYKKIGEGPHAVIVPGLFQNLDKSDTLALELASQFTVFVIGPPGIDGSTPLNRYSPESVCAWWERALDYLEVEQAILITKSMGFALIAPYLALGRNRRIVACFSQEPVTRIADTVWWWQLLYQLTRTLRLVGLGIAAILIIWGLREALAVGLPFAKALKRTSVRALVRIGDLIADQSVTSMAERVSSRLPMVTFMGSKRTWWLLRRESISAVVDRLRKLAHYEIDGAGHMLRWRDQQRLGQLIKKAVDDHGILENQGNKT